MTVTTNSLGALLDIWPYEEYGLYDEIIEKDYVNYGRTSFEGAWVKGTVLLSSPSQQGLNGLKSDSEFEFFYAKWSCQNERDLDESIQGIFGLARPHKQIMIMPDKSSGNGQQFFLDAIKVRDKACDDCYSFSTNFIDFQNTSFIDFGRASSTTDGGVQIEVYDDFFWSMGMKAIRVGEDYNNAAVFAPNTQALFD